MWIAFQALRLFTGSVGGGRVAVPVLSKEHQDNARALFAQFKAQYLSPPVSGLGTLGNNADTPQTSAAQADALNWTPAESGLTQRQYDVLRDYTGALY